MGTRGFITFVVDGEEKTAYNHWDSYPAGLGADILTWLKNATQDVEKLHTDVRALRVVEQDSQPSQEDIERLLPFADTRVSTGAVNEWYVLLRHTQGQPAAMLEAGVIEDHREFPRDSLFAEWGYVVDLDEHRFEVYRGHQSERHDRGRFADREPSDGYFPVALVKAWSLKELPGDADLLALDENDEE